MKRIGVVFVLLVFLFTINFSLADNCTSFNYSNWSSCSSGVQTRTVISSSPLNCTGGSPVLNQSCTSTTVNTTTSTTNLSKIEKGFSCLETLVKDDCSGAKSIQEVVLTIMASPKSSVSQGCYTKLKTYELGNCFGISNCNIKDTSLAVLALAHLRQDTKKYQDWLLNQTLISKDIIWFMQQDSLEAANCKVTYNSQDYLFSVQANKKIDSNAGSCLSLANSDYWYSIDSSCYDNSFALVCDKDFVGNLIYKQPSSSTIYVLSNTQSSAASGTINLQVKSKCFGTGSCDYESSAWAAVALNSVGIKIDEFIPYLVASSDVNKQYLPYAFLNLLVDYSEYGTKLIQMQSLNSWQAENTVYNQYYDTALALISLVDSSATEVKNAREWLTGYAQNADGCWNNDNIRDTAIILWALQNKPSLFIPGGPTLTTCSEGNFFCIKSADCPSEQVLVNYAGCTTGKTCCKTQNIKQCSEYYGEICASGKVCNGDVRVASDSSSCCLASCVDAEPEQSECGLANGICKETCSASQEQTSESCTDSQQVCCQRVTVTAKSNLWWLWLLLILLIVLVILAIIFKDKIKIWLYKRKSGFKKDEGNNSGVGGGPSGPGPRMIPPPQRPMMRPMPGQIPIGMQRRPLPQQMPNRMPPRV